MRSPQTSHKATMTEFSQPHSQISVDNLDLLDTLDEASVAYPQADYIMDTMKEFKFLDHRPASPRVFDFMGIGASAYQHMQMPTVSNEGESSSNKM